MTETTLSSSSAAGRLQWWVLVALCGITLAVFGGVWGHEFVHYDDAANIYRNPHLKGLGWEELKWMFTDTTYARRYMPLGWMSYAVDYQLFGLNPRAYHLGNLLLHAVNVVLLFFLLKRLLTPGRSSPEPCWERRHPAGVDLAGRMPALPVSAAVHGPNARSELAVELSHEPVPAWSSTFRPCDAPPAKAGTPCADPSAIWCAAIGALFWAVSPLRVESVAWASSRIYGVVFLFTMLWLLAWLRARDPATPKARRSIYHGLSMAAYAASLLTYPLMLFAPVALFALEMFPFRNKGLRLSDWWRQEAFRKLWLDKIPFLALSAGALALTFSARMVSAAAYRPPTLGEFSLLSRAMQSFYIWAYYAWKPWAPYDLSATYTTLHSFNPLDVKFLLSAGGVMAVTLVLIVWWKRWPAALGLWLCHLALLVPALGLTEYPHSPYDRYSHLQGVLWSVAIALLLRKIWDRGTRGQLAGIAVVAASLLFALLAWQQVPVWRDTISLYRHMVAHLGEHPNRSRFDEVLGVHYLRAGLTNEAAASFQDAIHYESRRADRHLYDEGVLARAHLRLGDLLSDEDRLEEALNHYRAALKAKPGFPAAMTKLRSCLTSLHRGAEAVALLGNATTKEPRNEAQFKSRADSPE